MSHALIIAAILGLTSASSAQPRAAQTVAPMPVVSKDPAVQRQIEAQLAGAASVRLDRTARVSSLAVTARPLKEVIDAVATAAGVTVRYPSGITSLDVPASVTLSEVTVEDALRAVLEPHALTFQAMGSRTAFIYPDTPANLAKYTAAVRVFPIAKAQVMSLAQQLNQALRPSTDGFRAMILSVSDSRSLVVRAIPEHMAWIAEWIAEHDKGE